MSKAYKLNGKYISKKDIPKTASLIKVVKINEEHYETKEYSRQQSINASNFFSRMADQREELEKRHG